MSAWRQRCGFGRWPETPGPACKNLAVLLDRHSVHVRLAKYREPRTIARIPITRAPMGSWANDDFS